MVYNFTLVMNSIRNKLFFKEIPFKSFIQLSIDIVRLTSWDFLRQ